LSIFSPQTFGPTVTVVQISALTNTQLAPAAWGFLMILNPLFVTVFQLRLTRRVAHVPASLKLGLAMPMMGVPFLLLDWNGTAPVIGLVIVIFVLGEMLWVPTSQAVVAALAPADIRGAYMGAFGGTWSVGWAATPFLGLQVRHAYGDATMWLCVAAVGVVAGLLGFAAARGHDAEAAVASPA
jgi:dipeptide/tripeptide permease